jgi:hypothetical protein
VKAKELNIILLVFFVFVLEFLVAEMKTVCVCELHVSVAEAQHSGKTWLWCEWGTRTESTPFLQWNRLGNGSFCQ